MTLHPDRDALVRKSERMAVIGAMTRGVAHEFNNILHGIIGSMEVTRKLIAQGRIADSERFADAAITSARRAANLTRRLLECAQPETGNPQTVNVRTLLESLEPLLRASLPPATRLEVAPCAEDTTVHCDANGFEIAIFALVVSAVDANPGGGVIGVRADGDKPPFVRILVSHSAPGATARMADHPALSLAERFARGAGGDMIVSELVDGAAVTGIQLPREQMPAQEYIGAANEPAKITGL
jgi:signal transduction histidine kinase